MIKYILIILLSLKLFSYNIVAHRGYVAYPENSKESIRYALKNGYDGVEIDIQPLKDSDDFVLLHDLVIKREIKASFLNSLKPSVFFTKDKWVQLNKKDRSGHKTSYKATTLKEVLELFKNNCNNKQFLNIEIKSPLVNTQAFYNIIKPYKSTFTIQVSSNYLDKLQELRQLDKYIYLGYIFLPNAKGVKKQVDKKVNSFLGMMNLDKYKQKYEDKSQEYQTQYEQKITKQYFKDLKSIKTKLAPNMGIHIDFEDVKKYSKLFTTLSQDSTIKIYIYSLDKSITNKDIKNYFDTHNIKLDGIISDEDIKADISYQDSLKKKNFFLWLMQ